MDLHIRKETVEDIEAIEQVTIAAFTDHPVSRLTEHFIIRALRKADSLTLSLVAELDAKIVGHIAYSPVVLSDGTSNWFGVGPLSVLPELQRRGIGKALMKASLIMMKDMGARGVALVGDPNYYKRYGFANYPQVTLEGVPPEVFMLLPFGESVPEGTIRFHEAFMAEE